MDTTETVEAAEFQPVAKALLQRLLDDDTARAATVVAAEPPTPKPEPKQEPVREVEPSRLVQIRNPPIPPREIRRAERRISEPRPMMGERLD